MRRIMFILNLAQGKLRGIALVKPTWGSGGGEGRGEEDLVDKWLYRHLIPNSSVIV